MDLSKSIAAIGLQSAPTVVEREGAVCPGRRPAPDRGAQAARRRKRAGPAGRFRRRRGQDVDDQREPASGRADRGAAVAADRRIRAICRTRSGRREYLSNLPTTKFQAAVGRRHQRRFARSQHDARRNPPRPDNRRLAGGDTWPRQRISASTTTRPRCWPRRGPRSLKSRSRC